MNNLLQKSVVCGGWRATVTSVRYRRVNVQRPRAPHFERAQVLELIKPQFKEDPSKPVSLQRLSTPSPETCLRNKELLQDQYRPDNPYERIVAKEIEARFKQAKLIGIVHTNPISGEDRFWANIKLKREQMELKVYSHHTVRMALDPELYAPVHQLFKVHQALIFCKEPKVDKLIKVLKKIPQFILMAGIVEGKMLSLNELIAYSKLKDLTSARAQLAATLCLAQSRVIANLSHHQSTLIHQLKRLADNMSRPASSVPPSQPTPTDVSSTDKSEFESKGEKES